MTQRALESHSDHLVHDLDAAEKEKKKKFAAWRVNMNIE